MAWLTLVARRSAHALTGILRLQAQRRSGDEGLDGVGPPALVIDQPEDELDNTYLWSTILPALRHLKGRRQVILATHNANIVVNCDADQVIALRATSDRGEIADPKLGCSRDRRRHRGSRSQVPGRRSRAL